MEEKKMRWYDYITININYMGLTTRSQVLTPLIIPVLVQQFLGEEGKGAAVGTIRLWALMVALLAQALFGLLSDHTTTKYGKRRPYILGGVIGEVIIFMLMVWCAVELAGMTGYLVLFGLYILSMLTSNASHAATQSLIPDLVPEKSRGTFSGVKALFELPFPVIFVSLVISPFVAKNNIFMAMLITSIILVVSMVITMFSKEKPALKTEKKVEWKPFLNLVWMTVGFTAVILGLGELVKWSANLEIFQTSSALPVIVGVLGMAVSVVIGVWVSIRLALGKKEYNQRGSYTWWVINRLAFMVALTNLATFMVYFMQDKFDLIGEAAAGPASRVTMLVGVFVLLLAVPTGKIADRFAKKPMLLISGVMAAVGILALLLIPQMYGIYIAGGLIGGAAGIFYSSNWALGTELVPADKAGKYMGIQNLAGAGAGAIGAYLGGPIADQVGYTALFAIYGFMFLLSVAALAWIKEPKQKTAS